MNAWPIIDSTRIGMVAMIVMHRHCAKKGIRTIVHVDYTLSIFTGQTGCIFILVQKPMCMRSMMGRNPLNLPVTQSTFTTHNC